MAEGEKDSGQLKKLKQELKAELKSEMLTQLRRELNLEGEQEGNGSTLEERVQAWLSKQGFPLEMEVASIARDIGFDVAQSECYVDPETGEAREIDLVLSKTTLSEVEGAGLMSYSLRVECKSSKDKPWLMFSSPTWEDEDPETIQFIQEMYAEYSCHANKFARGLIRRDVVYGSGTRLYPRLYDEPWVGYAVTQAFSDIQGLTPFTALMSATKAALAVMKGAAEDPMHFGAPFYVAYSVIVIDVPLYAVSYSSSTKRIAVDSIQVGSLIWKHYIAEKTSHGVFIVTKDALPEFLRKCHTSAEWFVNQGGENLIPILLDHKEFNPHVDR